MHVEVNSMDDVMNILLNILSLLVFNGGMITMTKFLNIVLILMFLNSYDMRNVIFKELKTSQDIEIIKNDQTGIPDIALY